MKFIMHLFSLMYGLASLSGAVKIAEEIALMCLRILIYLALVDAVHFSIKYW